jgi:chromosome segregation ATPase
MGAYERIQDRLIDRGRFQLEQALVLQLDEIRRLREVKRQMDLQVARARVQWLQDHQALEKQIREIAAKISEVERQHQRALRVSRRRQSPTINRLMRAHAIEMDALREQSGDSHTEIAGSFSTHDDDALAETLRNLSNQIEAVLSGNQDDESEKIEETEARITRLSLEVKAYQLRAEALSDQVEAIRGKMEKSRRKSSSVLDEVEGKIQMADRSICSSKSRLDSSVIDISEHIGDASKLATLRAEVFHMNRRVEDAQRDIQDAQTQFSRQITEYEEEKMRLTASLQEEERFARGTGSDSAQLEELECIENLHNQLRTHDSELQKLRQTNLELLRKVNQRDYEAHGRIGAFQRASKLAEAHGKP